MEIRDWHFGGWNQIEIVALQPVRLFGELGKLAGSDHNFGTHEIRRRNLSVAMLSTVQIEHASAEPSGWGGALTREHVETAPGQLRPPLRGQDSQILAKLPVGTDGEVELTGRAPTAHLDVLCLTLADRYR